MCYPVSLTEDTLLQQERLAEGKGSPLHQAMSSLFVRCDAGFL